MDEPWVRGLLDADPASVAGRPGARVVKENAVRTVWRVPAPGGEAAYLKLFRVSPLAAATKYLVVPSRAKAEWEASRGLREAGIPAAEVLGFAEVRTSGLLRRAACVVREFPDAMELVPWMHRRWGREGPFDAGQAAARRDLLERLGKVLRRLHDAGFRHPDLHGGNLLLAREGDPPGMCLIDLHTVGRGTPDREGDLATLLHSLLTATTAEERGIVRAAYGGGAEAPEARLAAMEARRLASRCSPAKLFGPTGRFDVGRSGDLRMVFLRAWGAAPFAAALGAHRSSKDVLKRGGRSTVTRVQVPGPSGPVRLVVKETKVRGAMDLLKNALRRPRGMEAWAAGNGLWHRDIDCAEPRACAVRGSWPLRRESFLVMEDVAAGGERFDLRSLRLWGGGGAAPREEGGGGAPRPLRRGPPRPRGLPRGSQGGERLRPAEARAGLLLPRGLRPRGLRRGAGPRAAPLEEPRPARGQRRDVLHPRRSSPLLPRLRLRGGRGVGGAQGRRPGDRRGLRAEDRGRPRSHRMRMSS